jgi:hypothetical protein
MAGSTTGVAAKMASLPSREKVLDDLTDHIAEFRPAMTAAFQRWRNLPGDVLVDLNDSARATVLHCFIVAAISKRLAGVVEIYDKSALKLFVIGQYAIRFKKHDETLSSRNQETDQVKAFMGQQTLDGIPSVHNLEAGYILNGLGTDIVSTNVVCPNGYKNSPHWHIELHDDGYELGDVVDLFPTDPQPKPTDSTEIGQSKWKRRESGVIIPFDRSKKPR